jgi:hypothetical protein
VQKVVGDGRRRKIDGREIAACEESRVRRKEERENREGKLK